MFKIDLEDDLTEVNYCQKTQNYAILLPIVNIITKNINFFLSSRNNYLDNKLNYFELSRTN